MGETYFLPLVSGGLLPASGSRLGWAAGAVGVRVSYLAAWSRQLNM
jgi:hypothetical protein